MKIYIEAVKQNPTDADTTVTMSWDTGTRENPQPETNILTLSDADALMKIAEFKARLGTGYVFHKHLHYTDRPCMIEEI